MNDENGEFEKKECMRNECVSVKRAFLEMGARCLLYSPVCGYEICTSISVADDPVYAAHTESVSHRVYGRIG